MIGPNGERRPGDTIANALRVAKIGFAAIAALLVIACQNMTPEEPVEEPPKVVDLEVTRSATVLVESRYLTSRRFSVPEITQDVLDAGGVRAKIQAADDLWIDLPYTIFEHCFYDGGDDAVCGVTYFMTYGVGSATFSALGVVPRSSVLLDIDGTRIRLFFAEPAR
jgi:hypothetical protein